MIKGTDCLCFLGDSITEGVGTAKRYIDYIAEETGAEVHGYGVNGAQSVDLFAQIGRMQKETDGCFDILFVCIGTNDYNAGVPLGEFFTEAAETVVCGYDGNGNAVRRFFVPTYKKTLLVVVSGDSRGDGLYPHIFRRALCFGYPGRLYRGKHCRRNRLFYRRRR